MTIGKAVYIGSGGGGTSDFELGAEIIVTINVPTLEQGTSELNAEVASATLSANKTYSKKESGVASGVRFINRVETGKVVYDVINDSAGDIPAHTITLILQEQISG